ncbi:TfoX/Sxy family protein [Pseudomonadota bacterium]
MPVSQELERYIVDLLESAGTVRSKRMFGGVGLYIDEAFCAIIGPQSGQLYLKVDDGNREDYLRENMQPFQTPKGTMSYYSVPEHILENPQDLKDWALKARDIAVRSKLGTTRK